MACGASVALQSSLEQSRDSGPILGGSGWELVALCREAHRDLCRAVMVQDLR